MGAVRIRWRALAKVAMIAVGVVVALQALPGLLQPPAPPPLAKDVGLRGIVVERNPSKRVEFLSHTESKSPRRERELSSPLPPGVISSVPHRHAKPTSRRKRPKERASSPSPEPSAAESPPPAATPPTPIEPSPSPPPPPPAGPDPPADGSEEFAPH